MTAIFAVYFDWSIESCDKAPSDLNYERDTEEYGHAMKLAIVGVWGAIANKMEASQETCFLGKITQASLQIIKRYVPKKKYSHN